MTHSVGTEDWTWILPLSCLSSPWTLICISLIKLIFFHICTLFYYKGMAWLCLVIDYFCGTRGIRPRALAGSGQMLYPWATILVPCYQRAFGFSYPFCKISHEMNNVRDVLKYQDVCLLLLTTWLWCRKGRKKKPCSCKSILTQDRGPAGLQRRAWLGVCWRHSRELWGRNESSIRVSVLHPCLYPPPADPASPPTQSNGVIGAARHLKSNI